MQKGFFESISKYMTLPGNGVHTVHTAKEYKKALLKKYYDTEDINLAEKLWKDSYQAFNDSTPLVLGLCSDCGGGIQRGANWGPLFLRATMSSFCTQKFHDLGDIKVIPHLLHDKYLNAETIAECRLALYADKNSDLPVSPLSIAEHFCDKLWKENPKFKLLSLGGDHSVSYPLVKQWLLSRKANGIKAAVLHFDAHTDLLDKRLGIDLCFGSWTYHILPYIDSPDLVVQVGVRSSGKDRGHWENTLGVKQFWPNELANPGLTTICNQIIQHFSNQGISEVYISCDIDALDEAYAGATGTPEPGGMQPHQIIHMIDVIGSKFKITGADLVEVAPFVKHKSVQSINPEPETTLSNATLIIDKMLEVMNQCQ